jgi:hypothetical protein
VNKEALVHWGAVAPKKKKNIFYMRISFVARTKKPQQDSILGFCVYNDETSGTIREKKSVTVA